MSSCVKSPNLSEVIAGEIAATGPLPFARFMERALYHPELGYYTSGTAGIGKAGDFYTNVSVGPAFGQVLAGQFEEMWERLGAPDEFTIVEQGSHDGQLALDILSNVNTPFAQSLRYAIVEPSANFRARQREKLSAFGGRVDWHERVEELPVFTGVHFSNELVDALPFHLIESQGDSWRELFVTAEGAGFFFTPAEFSPAIEHLEKSLPTRPKGHLMELRPAAGQWLQSVAARLERGFILVIDYGYPRDKLRAEHRSKGTFACFRQHRRDDKVLETPGEKDITAHVDFTDLAEAADPADLSWEGFADQNHFMVGAGENLLKSLEGRIHEPEARKTLRMMQTLLHPESMGTQFHYLAFSKNAPGEKLRGFRFGRDRAWLL